MGTASKSEDVRLTPSQDAELGRRMATFQTADAKTAVPWEEIDLPISIGGPHERCAFGSPPTRGADLNDALNWWGPAWALKHTRGAKGSAECGRVPLRGTKL